MKRRVIQRRVVVFLLLLGGGVIVNVAVAWTALELSERTFISIGVSQPLPPRYWSYDPFDASNHSAPYAAVGLPTYSWRVYAPYVTAPGLPTPLWPGFAINTIFYTAILWMAFFVPVKLKRTLRRRRGLCPACAYPIGTSPVCTECGKQLA